MSRRRVFVSGMGAVSPLGNDWPSTWQGLLAGRSGVRTIRRFDASSFETRIAAEVDWDEPQEGDVSEGDVSGRAIRMALQAASEALRRAELDPGRLVGRRAGVFMGCGVGVDLANQAEITRFLAPVSQLAEGAEAAFLDRVAADFDGRRSRWAAPEAPAAALARRYGARGPVSTHLTACAASAQALGEAFHVLAAGEADVALAGGSHGMVHPDGIMAFSRLGALSTRNDSPESASRPFDATRDGFVMGEGAALLVLETEEHLLARGGTPTIEVLGYGATADGYRATDPDPAATHVARALTRALEVAGLGPEAVDYINAHGTSTQANDAIETKAIQMALGERAGRVPVSSIKSMIGHLIAAAGAMEAATTVQVLRSGEVPPTINLDSRDPACDLDYVTEGAREVPVKVALSNSFGFGGQNVCLALGRV